MMKAFIGEYFKDLREELELTIEDFSKITGLSTTYISQIERNLRTPSKKKIFEILYYFNVYQDIENKLPETEIFELYSEYKKIPVQQLLTEYNNFFLDMDNKRSNMVDNAKKLTSNLKNNNLKYPIDSEKEPEIIDKPYFDLKWLLSQNEYHVFYGNEYITDNKKVHDDFLDKATFSKLSQDDKKMFIKIIESILENKYNKSKKD